MCAQRGKGNIRARNLEGQLPVQLAAIRNHTAVMHYLDAHSGDLSCMCRGVIRQALGKRCGKLVELALPPRLKLFLNYHIPYPGFSAVMVPPAPWTPAQLHRRLAEQEQVKEFITNNASEEFLQEHASTLARGGSSCNREQGLVGHAGTLARGGQEQDLVEMFQEMYLWEAFKPIDYEEPLPREPRYSLEKIEPKRPTLQRQYSDF